MTAEVGPWAKEKLEALERYLGFYTKVMKNQTQWRTIYIDAFAGGGVAQVRGRRREVAPMADLLLDVEPGRPAGPWPARPGPAGRPADKITVDAPIEVELEVGRFQDREPVPPPAEDAQNNYIAVCQQIDDQMAFMAMDPDRRGEIEPLTRQGWKCRDRLKDADEIVDIAIGLVE
jgi:hypothetical protein